MRRFVVLLLLLFCLVGVAGAATQATLTWTAPGDDGNVGTAAFYELRWATARPDTASVTAMDTWWSTATAVPGMPAPLIAGTVQTKVVLGTFGVGTHYYFVIRASDEVPNVSGYSNVADFFPQDMTPPTAVVDLRAR